MKRLLIILAPFFILGILIYSSKNYFIIGAALTALFLMCRKKYSRNFVIIFPAIFIILGIITSVVHTKIFENTYKELSNGKFYEGYIVEKNGNNFMVRNYKNGYKIEVYSYNNINAIPGDYISFKGKLSPVQEYKKRIINSLGINGYITISNNDIKIIKKKNLLLLPYKIKYNINTSLTSIDKNGGAFISGLISGYTSDMSLENKDNFTNLGISHILAVSGFNIAIIYYFSILILKGISARKRYIITLIICFIYTFFGGFQPSITRAFIMILIATLGKIINRNYDILNGITLTVIIMLIINSFYIYNMGFLLSFAATYGIIVLKDDISDKLPNRFEKIKDETSVSISAFITTLPIILWSRGFFSITSLIINILIGPFVAFTTIFAFISTVVYLLIGLKIVYYPSVLLGILFVRIANAMGKLNLMMFPGRPPFIFFILYIILLALFFNFIKLKVEGYKRSIINYTLCIAIVFSLLYHSPYLKIHILNVGQGDSIFIETPKRHTILIDTGPKIKEYIAARDKVVPYINRQGYNKLDLLIITHSHNDHAGGLEYLLKNIKIGEVISCEDLSNASSSLDKISKGDIINVEDVSFKILAPESNQHGSGDENETCLIFELRYKGFSALFTGDAEKEEMDKISGHYNVLKVPHHGSINSYSKDMMDNSTIETAIVSVGKNNFGHPSAKIIDEFKAKNVNVLRTDEQGNITVVTSGENYKILFE